MARTKSSIRRTLLATAIALAGAVAAPTGAFAAVDGTSNTIMFASSSIHPAGDHRPAGTGFMDYTDDDCLLKATARAVAGGQEGEE